MPIPSSRSIWRGPLLVLGLLAGLALLLAVYHYATGADYTLRVQQITQLKPVPLVLKQVPVGLASLPLRANGYLSAITHDVAGPYVRPEAAAALLGLLAVCLIYFLAVVSTLPRAAFVGGMALLIFLLMSFNADLLGIINSRQQYFLVLMLLALGLPAFVFHAFRTEVSLSRRLLAFTLLVAGLSAIIIWRSQYPLDTTVLHLASFATVSGAVIVALLVLWVGFENIHGLLWFNTQAENPASRFGLLPFVLASLLYLGMLLLYCWTGGDVFILPGIRLEPYLLLLPAVAVGWLSLRRRSATYAGWAPYWPGAAHVYLIFTTLAAGFIGYNFATANDPLLTAGRDFIALTFLLCGAAFLLYVLINFGPLLRQRKRVYRVVYEPRRLPFYAVYLLSLGGIFAFELRNAFFPLDQVKAGYYNNLGDLTRLQSEQQPGADALALLAERYYAESDLLDLHNLRASWGRAALYRFRAQRQNEINALRRAQARQPSEKISLRLAALYNEPTDFFDRLQLLREGLKATPRSARLASDLGQLYTRSNIADSVTYYFARAEAIASPNPVVQVNRLAYLVQNQQLAAARQYAQAQADNPTAAWQANLRLLLHLSATPVTEPPVTLPSRAPLTSGDFAALYHDCLRRALANDTSQLPQLRVLAQSPDNSSYLDQLTFLRALTQHYGGQPVAAQTTLLPLTTGGTPSSAYYQQVWGLWLLEQHLFATSIPHFTQASRSGYTEASLAKAYAQALNGQLDSALASARQAALLKAPDVARPARQLLQLLPLQYAQQYASLPDSGKAQYLVLRGGSLPVGSLLAPAAAIATPAAREAALLAQLPRAVQAGQLADVPQIIRQFAPAPGSKSGQSSRWNVLRGQLYVLTKQPLPLRQLLASAYFSAADRPYWFYYQAVLADFENKPTASKLYAQLGQKAPFVEAGMLAAADFYTRRHDYTSAYSVLLRGLENNPESVALLKAYTLAGVSAGLSEYAATPLAKLQTLLSPTEYLTFHTQYVARRAAQAATAAPWN